MEGYSTRVTVQTVPRSTGPLTLRRCVTVRVLPTEPHAIAMQCPELVLAHQPCDAVLAAGFAGLTEIQEDSWGAVDSVTRVNEARIKRRSRASSCARFETGCASQAQ